MAKQTFLLDVERIRERARQNIDRGAVVESYGADVETAVRLLNEALATELVCTLRYKRHYHTARGIHAGPVAEEFLEHAHEEEQHADRIAQRIVQLGGEPDYNPDGILTRSHAEYVEGDGLLAMVREDLVAERIAIETYREMVHYFGEKDPTSRRLMEEILANEEEHADDLAAILADLGPDFVLASTAKRPDEGLGTDIKADSPPQALGRETGPLPRDVGYGPSHGYSEGHGGPSSPGDAPAETGNGSSP